VLVIGPPWRAIDAAPTPAIMAGDPPVLAAERAWAAMSPALGVLERAGSRMEADARAIRLAAHGDGVALVMKGALHLRSGAWLWPAEIERVELDKAANPLKRTDLVMLVDKLHRQLAGGARAAERQALADAAKFLRADWPKMPVAQADRLIARVRGVLAAIPKRSALSTVLRERVPEFAVRVAESTRGAMKLPIQSSLAASDRNVVRRIMRTNTVFVTDEYGKRADRWASEARRIIARGTDRGLGRDVVARDLQEALGNRVTGRTDHYFWSVAAAATSRARSFGQTTGYVDAGFGAYQWSTTGDEQVCPVCRALDGSVFSVQRAVEQFARADDTEDSEAAVNVDPWYAVQDGVLYERHRAQGGGGVRGPRMASVNDGSAVFGDDMGTTPMPPAHAGCRCTTIPVENE